VSYRVNGVTVATAATDAHAVAALWNPHATARIRVVEISLVAVAAPGAGAGIELRRITARGTPGSTVTPAIQQHDARAIAPPSGALLDLAAYTVQPTLEAGGLWGWVLGAVIGSGFIYPVPLGIVVPPGAGLALVNRAAIIVPASEVAIVWQEHDD
jgi:hypothetical protein